MWQNINLWGFGLVWYLVAERFRLTFCLIGSQPASQLASCSWPANQLCDNISTCQALGWSDIWWQEDREPDHIGPQSRVLALPLVTLGEWPTNQGQSSDTNELCSLLYTFGTMFRDHLQFILACNVEKWYMDYVLSRPIYTHPSTINLMYYYTKVLLLRYYFYHQKSQMLWKSLKKVHLSLGQPDLT